MRMNWMPATAIVAMSVTAAVGAQSAKMTKASKGDTSSTTYTGCVESVNHGGAFLLTMIDSGAAESMHDDMTVKHHDDKAMNDAPAGTMPHDQMPMADEKMKETPSKAFALAGPVSFSKHVGQKVAVAGSLSDGWTGTMRQDVSTLTVKTLKVIAKSCS